MGHWLVMTRDLKYLPASIPWPQGSMDPAIEPLRAPSWPSDEVGSSNCSRQEGQEITPGFGRSRTGRGRSSGRASQRPRIDLESKVRPGRNSSRSFSPLESPLHPTLLIPGASWLRSSQRPPRAPAGNGQVERDRSSAPHPGRRGQAEPAPGGVQSAAATPALLPLAPPPGVPGRLAPATGEAAASPRRLRGAVPPRPPLARPSPRPLPSARPAPPPLATRGLISPGLPLRGPCAARKPTRRGAGRAVHSLDARRGRTGPGGSPPPVLVPAPPRSPPPRAGVPGLRAARPARTRRGSPRRGGPGSGVTMEEPQRARSHTVTTTASSFAENFSTTSSSFAYDREFLRTLPGLLIVAEIVSACGGAGGRGRGRRWTGRRAPSRGVCSHFRGGGASKEPFFLNLAFIPRCRTQRPRSLNEVSSPRDLLGERIVTLGLSFGGGNPTCWTLSVVAAYPGSRMLRGP